MRYLVFVLALAGVASGCGGGCPEGTTPRGDGCVAIGTDAPLDVPVVDASDTGSDAGEGADGGTDAGCEPSAADPIDLAGTDSNCDGVDGVDGAQIYVSPTGDDGNAGTRRSPVRSVNQGLFLAAGRPVLVAVGTYETGASFGGAGVVSIHGGFDPTTWARTTTRSVILVDHDGARLELAAGESVLDTIEVRAASGTLSNWSSRGLLATGPATAILRLVRARVVAGDGGTADDETPNADGTDGAYGNDGAPCPRVGSACDTTRTSTPGGLAGMSCRRTGPGTGGASAMAGLGGSGPRDGGGGTTVSGGDGGPGEPGGDGMSGTNGAGGGDFGTLTSALGYVPSSGIDGQDGEAGGAGGGGAGGANGILSGLASCSPESPSWPTLPVPGGSGGGGGGGGCGGGGGRAGDGGAGSFAILVSGVVLRLEDAEIVTGRGGDGGDAGAPGEGGAGGLGGRTVIRGGPRDGMPLHACLATVSRAVARGGDGGDGGHGGRGGEGGGGGGGPSIGVLLAGAATVTSDAATTFDLGPAGLGGSSPGNRGRDGVRAETYEIEVVTP